MSEIRNNNKKSNDFNSHSKQDKNVSVYQNFEIIKEYTGKNERIKSAEYKKNLP